jgi:hypothetical protein
MEVDSRGDHWVTEHQDILLGYHDPTTKTALYRRLSFACIRFGRATPQREAGMATNVNVMFRDVHNPRHASAMVTALDKTDKFVSDAVMTMSLACAAGSSGSSFMDRLWTSSGLDRCLPTT